jgi:hypothetical protein
MDLASGVKFNVTRDGAAVIDVLHGHMFRMNLVGARILEGLRDGLSADEISARVSREFGADVEEVKRDVLEFLAELEKHSLLQRNTTGV